jgi:hypothetical protein
VTTGLRIVAPSDAQLAYISGLCEERGLEPPQVVGSMAEASEIIGKILRREYNHEDYTYDSAFGWSHEQPF